MVAKRGTRAEVAERWRDRLNRWRRLGCSISEFCEREGISQPSFFQWRRRLQGELPTARRRGVGRAFVPIEVVANPASNAVASESLDEGWMQISLGAVVLRVPVTIAESALRQLVRVVREETGAC
jgi:hypothetical protein